MPEIQKLPTVLIVEDEALVRMQGVDILEEAGFDVLEAANGDDALIILARGIDVHLLFSDIGLPGSIDGLGLARIVHQRWPDIHLLLTSAQHRMRHADVPGAGMFVRKPWASAALVQQIQELVHR